MSENSTVAVSWLFLAVSIVGAAFTLVALFPPRRPVALVALTFFAAWLTTELAVLHLAWQLVATIVFVACGALDAWPGRLGLAITFASWCGLVLGLMTAMRTQEQFGDAIDDALGAAWHEGIEHQWVPATHRIAWRNVLLPFRVRRGGVERIKNLAYVDDGLRRHRLDVYRRPDVGPGAPVLLQIHGGAWMVGSKEQQGLPLMYRLAARGWVCVAINYRLSPRATWPDHLVDCKRALAWIRAHAAEYGGDPSYVVVTGGSAGGHLTAMMGLTANQAQWQPGFEDVDTSVRAMIPFYGVFDWTGRFGLRGRRDPLQRVLERYIVKRRRADAPEVFRAASPIEQIGPHAPPALVVHGDLDRLAPVEEARRFVEMLRDASEAPVVYVELSGAHHAFELFHSVRSLHALTGVEWFLAWLLTRQAPGRDASGADPTAAPAAADATNDPTTTVRTAP
jgi:acetyl esterase/lipase